MDPPKQKKPSLSRLATRKPDYEEEHTELTNRSVPPEIVAQIRARLNVDRPPELTADRSNMVPKIPAESNIHKLPTSERQAIAPFLFPEDDKDDENVAPIKHDVQESKPAYVTDKSLDADSLTTTGKKTMYYEDAFAVPGTRTLPKEKFLRDWVLVAELITNIKAINQNEEAKIDKAKVASDLATTLGQIYHRPDWGVQVVVQHDALIVFAGSSIPSYLLKIYALPSAIGPVTNMRNTKVIQDAIYELFGMFAEDGVILFLPVPQENLTTYDPTTRGEFPRLESSGMDSPGLMKSTSRSMSRRFKSNSGSSAPVSLTSTEVSPTLSTPTNPLNSPVGDTAPNEEERDRPPVKKRKSLRAIIHRHKRPKKEGEMKEKAKE